MRFKNTEDLSLTPAMQNKIWDTEEHEEFLKRKFVSNYVYLILFILMVYSCFFFSIKSTFAYYTLGGGAVLLYSFLIMRKNYPLKGMVHIYFIGFSLFVTFVLLNLWQYSIAGCLWLFPIPLGAYMFFEKKYTYIYTGYIIFLIIISNILSSQISFDYLSRIKQMIFNYTDQTNYKVINVELHNLKKLVV